MSRPSRPPGFEMSYRPQEARRFGPSFRTCAPAYVFFALTVLFAGFVGYGYAASPGSFAYRYVVEASSQRVVPSSWFALVVFASGLGAVFRAHLRGVVVHPDGIETLDLLALGWPRVRRIEWAMIDRMRFDAGPQSVGLELWNGSREVLPRVARKHDLVGALVTVAEARAIPYTGGPDGSAEPHAAP